MAGLNASQGSCILQLAKLAIWKVTPMPSPDTRSTDENLGKKELADLHMRNYSLLKQEIFLQISNVKNHVRNSQLVITGLISIMSFLLVSKEYGISEQNIFLWIFIMMLGTTVIHYLLYDVLDSVFALNALGEYLASVERKINDIAESKVLIWETVIAEKLWRSFIPVKGVIQPIWVMNIYPAITILFLTVVLPIYVYYSVWVLSSKNVLILMLVILCGTYSIISFVVAICVAAGTYFRLRPGARHLINETKE